MTSVIRVGIIFIFIVKVVIVRIVLRHLGYTRFFAILTYQRTTPMFLW